MRGIPLNMGEVSEQTLNGAKKAGFLQGKLPFSGLCGGLTGF